MAPDRLPSLPGEAFMTNADEKWPDDILAVVCLRVEGANRQHIVKGSTQKACVRCESMIWVSPATLKAIAGKKYGFLCMECAQELQAKSGEDAKVLPPTPETIQEVRDHLRRPPPEVN
jgi:hypothetical protein